MESLKYSTFLAFEQIVGMEYEHFLIMPFNILKPVYKLAPVWICGRNLAHVTVYQALTGSNAVFTHSLLEF